jgi:heme exporter protein CcmD
MDVNAPHFGFVVAAYALTVIFIAGLVVYVLSRDRILRAEAARFDRRRHSDTP